MRAPRAHPPTQGLVKHYEEHLGVDMDQLVAPDVSLIAKARDHTELIKLAQLVLGCLVKNENNQFYIANIMQLGASAQQALMGIIGEVRAGHFICVHSRRADTAAERGAPGRSSN